MPIHVLASSLTAGDDRGSQERHPAPFLRPDGKSQVSVALRRRQTQAGAITAIVLSTQHSGRRCPTKEIREGLHHEEVVKKQTIPAEHARRQKHQVSWSTPPGNSWSVAPMGDSRPDRTQNHCGHLRRHGPSRRWCLLRQGPLQGGPQRGVLLPLHGQEPGRGGAVRPLRGAARLRDRRGGARLDPRRVVRYRQGRGTTSCPRSCPSTSTPARVG